MTVLLGLLASVATVTLVLVTVAAVGIVGIGRLRRLVAELLPRLRVAGPSLGLLGAVLAVNAVVRRVGTELSWMIGWNITYDIYAIEGGFVPFVQSFARPWLTLTLSFAYVYGYVFLLVFPIVAYLALADLEWLRTAALAYALNYVVGLICYLLFVAYGPRNLLPDLVEPLLYTEWPASKFLTSQVNTNTNVFPSLHTSLSVTVAVLAYRTRRIYSWWLPVATLVGTGVVVSTMYLGIHWLIDVLVGIVLGVGSVLAAERLVDRRLPARTWSVAVDRARTATRTIRNGE